MYVVLSWGPLPAGKASQKYCRCVGRATLPRLLPVLLGLLLVGLLAPLLLVLLLSLLLLPGLC